MCATIDRLSDESTCAINPIAGSYPQASRCPGALNTGTISKSRLHDRGSCLAAVSTMLSGESGHRWRTQGPKAQWLNNKLPTASPFLCDSVLPLGCPAEGSRERWVHLGSGRCYREKSVVRWGTVIPILTTNTLSRPIHDNMLDYSRDIGNVRCSRRRLRVSDLTTNSL